MKNYNTDNFRELGITEINVECGCGFAAKDSAIAKTFIIDFKQFIPHRDNPNPRPPIGNSLVVTTLQHRIVEVGTIEEGMEKVRVVAERALGLILEKEQ